MTCSILIALKNSVAIHNEYFEEIVKNFLSK